MAEVDALALQREPLDRILDRVGWIVATEAIDMMGGRYGKRVLILAGPGLNGADGRAAARHLERFGVRADVVDALDLPRSLPVVDLVVDAAFGIGANRPWIAPDLPDAPVLAVDVPSAIDAVTGEPLGEPIAAARTVALMGLKPGLLLGEGAMLAGEIVVRDIGLDGPTDWAVIEDSDVTELVPTRPRHSHKWRSAVLVLAGSPGMTGAAVLASASAMRAGAGYVHLDTPAPAVPDLPTEVVGSFAGGGVRPDPHRFGAAVVGPGLGRSAAAAEFVRTACGSLPLPIVIDGDGLTAIAGSPELLSDREQPVILTPHDGEFERLTGHRPGADRVADVQQLSRDRGAVVLLKGPTTVVADPDGRVVFVTSGDQSLASAGTGDVLSGVVAAFLARGADPIWAAACAAHVHGRCGAAAGPNLVASDLIDQLPGVLEQVDLR